jgi:RNA polymerase subunit RPABC4/transcription elongation factor Spt4
MFDGVKRNEIITRAMGVCWHGDGCEKHDPKAQMRNFPIDCGTWDGFGVVLGWARQQKWFYVFLYQLTKRRTGRPGQSGTIHEGWVDPDAFADALYTFLSGDRALRISEAHDACPFCGSLEIKYDFAASQGYIVCTNCRACGPEDSRAADPECDIEAAFEAWRRRAI